MLNRQMETKTFTATVASETSVRPLCFSNMVCLVIFILFFIFIFIKANNNYDTSIILFSLLVAILVGLVMVLHGLPMFFHISRSKHEQTNGSWIA